MCAVHTRGKERMKGGKRDSLDCVANILSISSSKIILFNQCTKPPFIYTSIRFSFRNNVERGMFINDVKVMLLRA